MTKINKDQQFYAYYDAIEETGEVIYCGKGNDFRSNLDKSPKRNRYYNNIARVYKIIRVRIPTLDNDLALKLEDWLMVHYHTWIDDPLRGPHACNIDGPGTNDRSKNTSQETRKLLSIKGKERVTSQETRKLLSIANKGKKRSKETCKNIGISHLGIKPTKENVQNLIDINSKEIYQISIITGEIIAKWKSAVEASKVLNIQTTNITRCARSGLKQAGGFCWKYVQDYVIGFKPLYSKTASRAVYQLNKTTNQIIAYFKSITEASKILKIHHGGISQCCLGRRKTAGGYKWCYVINNLML